MASSILRLPLYILLCIVCVFALCISPCGFQSNGGSTNSSQNSSHRDESYFYHTNIKLTFSPHSPTSATDSQFILIFKEEAPLFYFTETGVHGLSSLGFIYRQLGPLVGSCVYGLSLQRSTSVKQVIIALECIKLCMLCFLYVAHLVHIFLRFLYCSLLIVLQF